MTRAWDIVCRCGGNLSVATVTGEGEKIVAVRECDDCGRRVKGHSPEAKAVVGDDAPEWALDLYGRPERGETA